MADGKIPLRDLSTNQIRGYANVLLAAGTSVQLDNLKALRPDVRHIFDLENQKNETLLSNMNLNEAEEDDVSSKVWFLRYLTSVR
jgi:hypothetical protein